MIWIISLDFTIFSEFRPNTNLPDLAQCCGQSGLGRIAAQDRKICKSVDLEQAVILGRICDLFTEKRVLIWKTCDWRSISAALKLLTAGCLCSFIRCTQPAMDAACKPPPPPHLAAGHVTSDSTAETRVWSLIVFSLAVVCLCLTRTGIRVFWACGLSPFKFSPSASERRFKLVWTRQID